MEADAPHVLFDLPQAATRYYPHQSTRYAPFADGRRFLFIAPAGDVLAPKINVVLNWTAALTR
jgi:hypothetical protein